MGIFIKLHLKKSPERNIKMVNMENNIHHLMGKTKIQVLNAKKKYLNLGGLS